MDKQSLDITALLEPPAECISTAALKMRDKRKGALWFCSLSRRIVGKGRVRPACLCKEALAAAISKPHEGLSK